MTPTPSEAQIALRVPTSKLRSAIVTLFHDVDIGFTRMKRIDDLITAALRVREQAVAKACAEIADTPANWNMLGGSTGNAAATGHQIAKTVRTRFGVEG